MVPYLPEIAAGGPRGVKGRRQERPRCGRYHLRWMFVSPGVSGRSASPLNLLARLTR